MRIEVSLTPGGTLLRSHFLLYLKGSELSQTCKEAFRLGPAEDRGSLNLQLIEVERDYGMEVTDQAPQFFPGKQNPKKDERSNESN